MCESKVIAVKEGKEEVLVDKAVELRIEGDKVIIVDILGRVYVFPDLVLARVDFLQHRVYLVERR
ncbi:MAG: RNA-binding protein [Thermoprotei archaeon]|nr:MAG: RNA-binding protein [Thermoprotei archaeon]